MKRYSIFMTFIILFLFVVHDGYTQTSTTVLKDMVIALDSSGSMKENDPNMLINQVALQILEDLSEGSRISFITFAGKASMSMPLTPVTEEGLNDKVQKILKRPTHVKPGIIDTVKLGRGETLSNLANKYYGDPDKWRQILKANNFPESVEKLSVGTVVHIPAEDASGIIEGDSGGRENTNIPAAVEKAIYELKHNGRAEAEKQIAFITDGIIDIRDSALAVERYRWLKDELASDGKKSGIRIFGIALTEKADFEFMQSLAHRTSGDYYRVFKAEDVQVAINGINEITLKSKPAPKPVPEVVQVVKTTPVAKPVEGRGGFFKVFLVAAAVVGLAALGVIIFALAKNRKKRDVSGKETSILGAYLMDMGEITEKSNYAMNQDVIKIGRVGNPDADVCINKGTVSGEHAQIEHRGGKFYLTDLGSTNGTYLNDEPEQIADEVLLNAGDIISFDQYKFKFVVRGQGDMNRPPGVEVKARPTGASETPGASKPVPDLARNTEETALDRDVISLEAYLEDSTEITDKKSHKISKRITRIGRARGNNICIDENTISAAHAQIEYKDNAFYLSDLGSRNGTYLNEERQQITNEVRLKGDDVIYFDQYKFKFVVHGQSRDREAQLSASPGKSGG